MATLPEARGPSPEHLPALRAEGDPPGPHRLWVDGEFALRLRGPAPGPDRLVRIRRPFGLLGRIAGSDVRIEDRAVSARHVYLHLDRRGLFGVDLATRTGSRFGPEGQAYGWLRPGQSFEVAGHRVELADLRAEAPGAAADPADSDPLADAGDRPLVGVTLHALHPRQPPRTLGSELVFIGRASSCGVRVEGATASRVHCVLVRTAAAAYVVDLVGRGTWLNGRPVAGAAELADGDALAIGSAQLRVRVAPATATATATAAAAAPPRPADNLPMPRAAPGPPTPSWPAALVEALPAPPHGLLPPDSIPADAQGAILAWMMGALQASQSEAMRRQEEFQLALTRLIQQMHRDNATLLGEHLERMERIDRELATLRAELQRRSGSADAADAGPHPAAREPGLPPPPPLRITPSTASTDVDPAASAAWLVARISQLEDEHRSTWKDLLGRLTGQGRRAP